MDNKIEVFKNEQFGEIRTALIENEPWFVAVDVCRALEIGNSSQAISRMDADEKMITLISNEGNKRGNPNMTVVNEPGLYTLILSSRKPEAKAFERWITHDGRCRKRENRCLHYERPNALGARLPPSRQRDGDIQTEQCALYRGQQRH